MVSKHSVAPSAALPAAMEDLEDDLGDQVQQPTVATDLFGDDDDAPVQDNYQQYEDDLEDEDVQPAAQAAPAAEAPATAEDRRAALMKLAQKKKREEGGDGDRKKKKKKRDGDAKSGDKGRSARPSRLRDKADREKPDARPARGAAAADEPELPSDEIDENAADQDFIDDDGVEGLDDEEPDGDDEGTRALLMPPEEAVEVARGEEDEEAEDDLFGRKKRKKFKESEQQMAMVVDDKIAKMEAAAEADMEQHSQSRPAIQKLKCLAEAEEFLAQKKYHELFVSAGGLGVLKAWLEPYSDGSLPNTRVRSAVLRACKLLPIDTSREDMKSQLKKSQLGTRVMFLQKCQDETPANRQLARELVQQWSRPIFFDPTAEAAKQKIREQQLKIARAAAVMAQKEQETLQATLPKASKIKHGEVGYRWHASIPQASKLDYVVEPKQDERFSMQQAALAAAHVPSNSSRFAKKMREVQRKQKSVTARAAKPSVEGRTITLMHT